VAKYIPFLVVKYVLENVKLVVDVDSCSGDDKLEALEMLELVMKMAHYVDSDYGPVIFSNKI
jgi:hypothetical protein